MSRRRTVASSRRTFLAATGAAAIAIPVPGAGLSFFSAAEAELLEAVCEQILPSDNLPGAREAGVVNYIDRQLGGTLARFASMYREGLAGLRAAKFMELSAEARTRLLEEAEAGRVSGVPAATVRMVIDHTMQGFLSDPMHGGNKDRVGWKMLGYSAGGHKH